MAVDAGYARLRKTLTTISAILAATIIVFVPGFYVVTAYQYEAERLQFTANRLADRVTVEVYELPEMWPFLENRFIGILQRETRNFTQPTRQEIFQLDGTSVAKFGPDVLRLALSRSADIGDEANPAGWVQVSLSMVHIWGRTGIAGLIGLVLGLMSFFTIRTLTLHDLTVQEKAAAAVLAAKRDAEYADRAKSEFLANMSHELRTPMNAIIGFGQMIRDQSLGPDATDVYLEYARDICDSGDHLLSIINDILDLSKIEAGEAQLHEQELDVDALVEASLTLIKSRAQNSGLALRSSIEVRGAKLFADGRMTKQMLLNLLSNAVKFTDPGGSVILRVVRGDRGGLKFSITDTGIGIAQDDIPRALSTFGQVASSMTRSVDGTGLGLPLVASLAKLHGGGLELVSDVGTGTTATIWFPQERVIELR